MKDSKGFIQIPLLIAIISSVLVLGGGGYFGIQKYKNYQAQKVEQKKQIELNQKTEEENRQKLQESLDSQSKELEKQKSEIEVLKNQKSNTQTIIKEVPTQISPAVISLQTVIKQWEPLVAYVECQFQYSNGTIYQKQSGSGILYFTGGAWVLTNRHVLTDSSGNGASACSIIFPNHDNNITTVINKETEFNFSVPRNDADAGFIRISNPDSYITNIIDTGKYCQTTPNLGDQVVVLGFPAIGSPTGVTATRGIISGYDGDYFITDAKIDHGNSGGVAIDLDNNCYLGLPTWAATGSIESLARILNWQAIHN